MLDHFSENAGQILDGLYFGLGILAVYLGAVLTAASVRSLGGAGSVGLTFLGRYITGWFDNLRGDDRNTVNVTLNMIVDNHLKFDTLVADRRIWYIWPNMYRMQRIRRAAKRTTVESPVVLFPEDSHAPTSPVAKFYHHCRDRIDGVLASTQFVENGKRQRIRLMKENDYRATYAPLISLVAENCTNENSVDLALGRAMDEYRFVIALTFEKLNNRRARHLRAMVVWEEALLNLPDACPRVDAEEHRTRFRTLQAVARHYREHPEHFGLVKMWRPKEIARDFATVVFAAGGKPSRSGRNEAAE
jgi:hypothetical protein